MSSLKAPVSPRLFAKVIFGPLPASLKSATIDTPRHKLTIARASNSPKSTQYKSSKGTDSVCAKGDVSLDDSFVEMGDSWKQQKRRTLR